MAISKDLKERWIARLESPEAKWAGGQLHDTETGGMCCLGHLADITDSWDDESRYTVHDNAGEPYAPFHGLTEAEMSSLVRANDDREEFPLDLIRALPIAEDKGAN